MSLPHPVETPAPRGWPPSVKLMVAGATLAFAAAVLLWTRFGPSVFGDALNAVWTCL